MTTPLDPDSPKGRRIAAELTRIVTRVELENERRKRREAADSVKTA